MMKIDLTCPVEAWRVDMPDGKRPNFEVTLFNLSSMQVSSVEVTLRLTDDAGEETLVTHRGRMLNGAPGRTFHMVVPAERTIRAAGYEVFVEKVWYDNGAVWRHEKENLTEYEANTLRRSEKLTQLRAVAGPHASDLIHEAVIAMKSMLTVEEAAHTMHAHPSLAEAFMECMQRLIGEAIHVPPARRRAK